MVNREKHSQLIRQCVVSKSYPLVTFGTQSVEICTEDEEENDSYFLGVITSKVAEDKIVLEIPDDFKISYQFGR